MKFSIITPTYRRGNLLERAIYSVLNQKHQEWEMIIINDSPDDVSYDVIMQRYSDPRIIYIKNNNNLGANASRNRGLDSLARDSSYVIFLDDDDWFAPNALADLSKIIKCNPDKKWIVTNRVLTDGTSLTRVPTETGAYNYIKDYLILKRIRGDATHCIATSSIKDNRFPTLIRQGEEWLFFFSLNTSLLPYYYDFNMTFSDGYRSNGLNFRTRTTLKQLRILVLIIREGSMRRLLFSLYFILYICIRFVRAFIKKN